MTEDVELGRSSELRSLGPATELEISEMLASFSMPDKQRGRWLSVLLPMGLTIDELKALVAKNEQRSLPLGVFGKLQKQKLAFRRWISHQSGISRLLYAGAWISIFITSSTTAFKKNPFAAIAAVVVFIIKARAVMQELSPKHMHLFERNYPEHRMNEHALIVQIQRWAELPPLAREIVAFQVDALKLIAAYVRDHRVDLGGKKIFVNLLIEDNENIVVIRRSDPVRQVPSVYSRSICSIAARAFHDGVHQVTGDLYADHPNSLPNKTYKSVLAIPVKLNNKVLAVVSIDSEVPHHFADASDTLPVLLGPYVQLIASSLSAANASLTEKGAVP